VRDLDQILLTLEAKGDHAGTRTFLNQYGHVPLAFQKAIERMGTIPVDIEPIFLTAEALSRK
jgi:hypothetical protein